MRTQEPRRGRPRRVDVEDCVAQATFEILREIPYSQLTVDLITERAGVSKTTIYRRWKSKPALVADAIVRSLWEPIVLDGPLKEAIRSSIVATYVRAREGGGGLVFAGLVSEMATDSELGTQLRARFLRPREDAVIEALQRGIETGELRGDLEPHLMYRMITGAIHFSTLVGDPLSEAQVEQSFDLIWETFTTSTEATGRGDRRP